MNSANLNNQSIIPINIISNMFGNNQDCNVIRKNAENLSVYSLILEFLNTSEVNPFDPDDGISHIFNNLRANENIPLELREQIFGELNIDTELENQFHTLLLNITKAMQRIMMPNDDVEESVVGDMNFQFGAWIETQLVNDATVLSHLSFHGAIFELLPNQHLIFDATIRLMNCEVECGTVEISNGVIIASNNGAYAIANTASARSEANGVGGEAVAYNGARAYANAENTVARAYGVNSEAKASNGSSSHAYAYNGASAFAVLQSNSHAMSNGCTAEGINGSKVLLESANTIAMASSGCSVVVNHPNCRLICNSFVGINIIGNEADSLVIEELNPHHDNFISSVDVAILNTIIADAGINDQITDDWCSANEARGFRDFLNRVADIKDMQSHNKDVWLPAKIQLANIILAMDKNPSIRNDCFNIALSSLGNCDDAVNFGFLRMQLIANKINHTDKSLSTLYDNQKKLSAFEYVAKTITTGKIEALKNNLLNPDFTEVGLAYLKGLKIELGIEISDMLYEELSHVTNEDIVQAKLMLNEYLSNEDNIYEEMAKSDVIKLKFANEFHEIENKGEYDTTKNDLDYNVIGVNIMRDKIACIKLSLQVEATLNA